MMPLVVLFLLPVVIGVASAMSLGTMRSASLVSAIGSPLVVYLCVKAIDPQDTWSSLATLLASPLVIAVAVTTVLLCAGRSHARGRSEWNGG